MPSSTEEPLLLRVYRDVIKLVPKRHETDKAGKAQFAVKGALKDVLAKRLKATSYAVDQALKELSRKGLYYNSSGGRGNPWRYFIELNAEDKLSKGGGTQGRRSGTKKSTSRKAGSSARKKNGRKNAARKATTRKVSTRKAAIIEMVELQPEQVVDMIGNLIAERDALRGEVERLGAEVTARDEQLQKPRPIEVPSALLERLKK